MNSIKDMSHVRLGSTYVRIRIACHTLLVPYHMQLRVFTFLCISYFPRRSAALDHHVQQQPTESLHHRVGLADLHLQGVGVVSVGWKGSKVTEHEKCTLNVFRCC